jgi:very-short-patch-repair endonuclease
VRRGGIKQRSLMHHKDELKKRGVIWNGRHLPYNPKLVKRAKVMRRKMTPAECKLWFGLLRTMRPRFLRQRPIDHYIADFYCALRKLVVEMDGKHHYTDTGIEQDHQRSDVLKSYGIRVIRFSNDEVMADFKRVCRTILSEI